MRTSSRLVALLLFDEVELLDVAAPLGVLSAAGRKWNFRPFKVISVAARNGPVETRNQLRILAEKTFGDCEAPEIVVIPGGYGARRALGEADVVSWLSAVLPGATDVLAVGNGVLLLAKAGLLADTDVSVPREAADTLSDLAPTCRAHPDEAWRSSGRILTAKDPLGATRAALHLVSTVLGERHATEVAVALGLDGPSDANARIEIVPGD